MTTPYTAGTVTLTNGSAVITGIGTAWQTALIAGGILIAEADGNPLPILSVDSNTQITAAIKWKGASGTYPYAIMRDTAYGQQTVANAQALANYLTRLDTATLSALNALGPSMIADRVPYATSNAAMAWAPFTAYGRAVVAATSDATFASAAKVVRRSGGANMASTNDVMVGWHSTLGGLIGQVDGVYLGNIWNDYYATNMGGAADIRSRIGAYSSGGGVINGTVTVNGALAVSSSIESPAGFYATGAAGATSLVYYRSGTLLRWASGRTSTAEAGNNEGSNFTVDRFSDAAGFLGTPFTISRRYGVGEFRENPACQISPGFGPLTFNTGQHLGWAGDSSGFNFLVGAANALFTIGGNPGAGGRVVHLPLSAYYRVNVNICGANAGATISLALNGGEFYPFRIPSNNWSTMSAEYTRFFNAGDYLSIMCASGPAQILPTECHLKIELFRL